MIGRFNIIGGVDPEEFINGVVEEARAQGVINAGDFVKFINDYTNLSTMNDTELFTTATSLQTMSAVALTDTKVFITYVEPNTSIYGVICNINGTSITLGTKSLIYYTTGKIIGITDTVRLNSSKVFIGFTPSTNCTGVVCTVSGNTITAGNPRLIIGNSEASSKLSVAALTEDKILFTCSYKASNNTSIQANVCTISGTTISEGAVTAISAIGTGAASEVYNIKTVVLNQSKVFLVYSYYEAGTKKYKIRSNILTISDKTITLITHNLYNVDAQSVGSLSAVALSENKIFLAFYTYPYKIYRNNLYNRWKYNNQKY